MSAVKNIVSLPERQILAAYAAGKTVTEISAAGHPKQTVTDLVADVAKFDRGRAREAVAAYDQRASAVAASKPAAATPEVSKPAAAPRQPLPPLATDNGQDDGVEDLLDAAELSENPRLAKAAARIREQIADLRAGVAAAAKERELREEIERHRAAAEKAAAELRALTGRPDKATTAASEHPAKKVREWAAANGVACPKHGRIPASVADAYRAAHGGAL